MKTYEEKTRCVFQKIEEAEAIQRNRSKIVKRIATPLLSLSLVAAIGIGAWKIGIFQKPANISAPSESETSIPNSNEDAQQKAVTTNPTLNADDTAIHESLESSMASEQISMADNTVVPENLDTQDPTVEENFPIGNNEKEKTVMTTAPKKPETQKSTVNKTTAISNSNQKKTTSTQIAVESKKIVTGKAQKGAAIDTSESYEYILWNHLSLSGELKSEIDANPDAVFAVLATYRPTTGDITDFTYDGKTLAEWAVEADNERILPEKMLQLLKQGDELKYGTALYETGTPDGIKWDRSFYEERVAFFGDLLDKYIVNGQFLRNELENDIAALQSINVTTPDGITTTTYSGEASVRKQYSLAYNAYLDTILPAMIERLTENGIPCERSSYQNASISLLVTPEQLQNLPLDDLKSWYFGLDSGDLKNVSGTYVTNAAMPE